MLKSVIYPHNTTVFPHKCSQQLSHNSFPTPCGCLHLAQVIVELYPSLAIQWPSLSQNTTNFPHTRLQYYFLSRCWNAKWFIWRGTAVLIRLRRICFVSSYRTLSPMPFSCSSAVLALTTIKALYAIYVYNVSYCLLHLCSLIHSLLYQAVLTPLPSFHCCYGELGKCWLLIWCWMRHILNSVRGDLPT